MPERWRGVESGTPVPTLQAPRTTSKRELPRLAVPQTARADDSAWSSHGLIEPLIVVLLVLLIVAIASRLLSQFFRALTGRSPPKRTGHPAGNPLETVLLHWTKQDRLTLKGLLDGGIVILGRPGSGKSSSSSFQLLRSVVRYPKSGGLILSASSGDLALVKRAFAGHEDRLIIFDERTNHRFNAIEFIVNCGGSTKDILAGIMAISETVDRGGGGQPGGDEGSFFSIGAKRIIENAIVIVKHATGGVSPADLLAFINSAATSQEEFHSEAFKESVHYCFLKAAYEKQKTPTEEFDTELAKAYFTSEHTRLADRTRSSLVAVVMNKLHVFNSGLNRLLFATETSLTPRVMDEAKWVFVDMPISRVGQEGAFALGVFKFLTEWYVLRRNTERDNPPLIIHADEFHNTVNAFDARYLGECRKFSGCMIACSQSKASFCANMGGEAAEAQVDAMMNNFSHKIIHAVGDILTARWASELVGSAMQFDLGGSEQAASSTLAAFLGRNVWTGNMSGNVRPLLEARHFMHGFRTGGAANNYLCDAVVIRSGEPFASNGENFLQVAFSQR